MDDSAPAPAFALRVDEDLELVLREVWTAVPLADVVAANLEHLRAWEPWAQGEQTLEGLTAFTRAQLAAWLEGRAVPTAVRWRGRLVGAVGASVDTWTGTAELGYWVAADAQGRGVVTRSCAALVDHLVRDRGVGRVEARCVVANGRSRAVAERLGLHLDGVLPAAMPLRGRREDVALYGLPADRWRG